MSRPPPGWTPQQPFPPPSPPPAPARRKAGPAGRIVLGIVVLGAVGFLVFALLTWSKGAVAAGEGDCVKVQPTQQATAERVDCGAPDASYRVAKRLDSASGGCPDGDYTTWTGDRTKLCLMLNGRQGDCFQSGPNRAAQRAECGSTADVRVVKVVEGKADEAECAQGDMFATYSAPATTICLTEA